jgi:hypothetical protein
MRSDLVPAPRDFTHQIFMSFADPAQNEKSGRSVIFIEQVQHSLGGCNHTTRQSVPLCPADKRLQRRNLKVFLDVDREMMKRQSSSGVRSGTGLCKPGTAGSGCSGAPRLMVKRQVTQRVAPMSAPPRKRQCAEQLQRIVAITQHRSDYTFPPARWLGSIIDC